MGQGRYAMTLVDIDLDQAALRADVAEAVDAAWAALGMPGEFFTGRQRQAIIAEARNARSCGLCAERREALSPFAVDGDHDANPDLDAAVVDAVHRICTDSGRLSTRWHREFLDSGLTDGHLVELISTTVRAIGIDTFHRGLGAAVPELPGVVAGEPGGQVATEACDHSARVPTVPPEDATGVVAEHYCRAPFVANIWKSLTLVPSSAVETFALMGNWYVASTEAEMPPGWTITRPQVELVAATVSDHNECFY